ncbi:MAG: glycosyltransferase [Planctomycetota bacterium]
MTPPTPIRVMHVFGKMDRGGAEMRTLDLLPAMRDRGVRFDFCAMMPGEGALDAQIKAAGSDVHVCELRGPKLGFVRGFRKLLREHKPDIVHSHLHLTSGLIIALARSAGVRQRVVHFRSSSDGRSVSLPRRAYQAGMRRLIKMNATAILAVSHGAMAGGLGTDWEKDKRAKVIYNGINTASYPTTRPDRSALRRELSIPEDAVLVAQVGRFVVPKAHEVTVEALKQVVAQDKRFHVLLIGDGPLGDQTRAHAAQAGVTDHLHFLGLREDVPTLLAMADLSILPSHWEGLPGVVLESLAAGTRVVASDLPGVREIAAKGDGITIIRKADPGDLARAILQAGPRTQDPAHSPTLPEAFHLDTCASDLYAVYAGLTGKHGNTQHPADAPHT